MNRMKRVLAMLILVVMCIAVGAMSLVACTASEASVSVYFAEGSVASSTANSVDITDLAKDATLVDMLKANEQFNADIAEGGEFGPYLNSINGMIPDASYQYITVYTTISEHGDTAKETITHDDKTFYYSNVGIGELPVIKGESYIFMLSDWQEKPATVSIYFGEGILYGAIAESTVIGELGADAMLADMLLANTELNAVISDDGMLTAIVDMVADASYQFIAVYTTQEEYKTEGYEPIMHDGKTLYSSNLGVEELPLVVGESYAFVLTKWQQKADAKVDVYFADKDIAGATSNSVAINTYNVNATLEDVLTQNEQFGAVINASGVLTSVNGMSAASGDFIAVYTTQQVYSVGLADPIVYDGKTFYLSRVSIGELVLDNAVSYAFILTQPPIYQDARLMQMANNLNNDLVGNIGYAAHINTLVRAGVEFNMQMYIDVKNDLVAQLNASSANLGEVIHSTMLLLQVGMEIPDEVLNYINNTAWHPGWSPTWVNAPMLPVMIELAKAGYEMPDMEIVVAELVATGVSNDNIFPNDWDLDEPSAATIAVLSFYDRAEVKTVVDNTLRYIESKIVSNEIAGNLSSTGYVLLLAVESSFYGVAHNIDIDAMYEKMMTYLNADGSMGRNSMETEQCLQALLSYQKYKSGNGTYYASQK